MKDHGFCEGPGTEYRLDPEAAIRFFSVQPGVDYTPKFEICKAWKELRANFTTNPKLESLSIAKYVSGPFVALILPSSAPSKIDWIVPETPILDLWRDKLNRDLEQDLRPMLNIFE